MSSKNSRQAGRHAARRKRSREKARERQAFTDWLEQPADPHRSSSLRLASVLALLGEPVTPPREKPRAQTRGPRRRRRGR